MLWRIAGQRSRAYGQSGARTLTTQRALVGFCPRCSSVAHAAISGSFSIGAHSANRDVMMQLWQAYGPLRPRRFSAFQNASATGYLPKD